MRSPRIVIEGRAADEEAAQDVRNALIVEGFDVRLRRVDARRGPAGEVLELAIRLLDEVDSHLIEVATGAVVGALTSRLSRRKRATRRVNFYGPDGSLIKRIEVPTDRHDE